MTLCLSWTRKAILILMLTFGLTHNVFSQSITISGKIIDESTNEPINNVTVHLIHSTEMTLSKNRGLFVIRTSQWRDLLELTNIGYQRLIFPLKKDSTTGLVIKMQISPTALQAVVITGAERDKEPGRRYMKKSDCQ